MDETSEDIFQCFYNIGKQQLDFQSILSYDLASYYEKECLQKNEIYKNSLDNHMDKSYKITRIIADILGYEASIWNLLQSLLISRIQGEISRDQHPMIDQNNIRQDSPKEIIDQSFEKDSKLREAQILIDWLEKLAIEDCQVSVKFVEDYNYSFLDETVNSLKVNSQNHLKDSPFVTYIDPDVTYRQKKPYAPLDKNYEDKFLQCLYMCIRSGQLQKGQDLCVTCGQAWRAASLEGWKLYHDPNYRRIGREDAISNNPEGNINRILWKNVCWNLCRQDADSPTPNPYERAIYGVLSGNTRAVLPVCGQSWNDRLWAFTKGLVEIKVETILSKNPSFLDKYANFSNEPREIGHTLPNEFWNQPATLEEVFEAVELAGDAVFLASIPENVDKLFRYIVKLLILDDFIGLIQYLKSASLDILASITPKMAVASGRRGREEDIKLDINLHCLRIITHIAMLLIKGSQEIAFTRGTPNSPTFSLPESDLFAVISTYTKALAEVSQVTLLAGYLKFLPPVYQKQRYSQFLKNMVGDDASYKKYCLDVATDHGLDVGAITKTLLDDLDQTRTEKRYSLTEGVERHPLPAILAHSLDEEDRVTIDSLDWLILEPTEWDDALFRANSLIRTFIIGNKLACVDAIVTKLPEQLVSTIIAEWTTDKDDSSPLLPAPLDNAIKEFLSYKTFMEGNQAFNDWYDYYHKERPIAPNKQDDKDESVIELKQRVALEGVQREYEASLERWQETLELLTENTAENLFTILTFPDGGWLKDQRTLDVSKESRRESLLREKEMQEIRKMLLPRVLSMLVYVLKSTNKVQELTRVADAISTEASLNDQDIADLFDDSMVNIAQELTSMSQNDSISISPALHLTESFQIAEMNNLLD